MKTKSYIIIIVFIIFTQIFVSFFFSSQTIIQNNLFSKNQNNLSELTTKTTALKIKLTVLTSTESIYTHSLQQQFQPINQSLNLGE